MQYAEIHRFGRRYPRLRGEHVVISMAEVTLKGSSPLARGTQFVLSQLRPGGGIIPACAGNTNVRGILPRCSRDHPRLRGEHYGMPPEAIRETGSSPLARGTRRGWRISHTVHRIIPACAGNTVPPLPWAVLHQDYPRLRGEHS